MRRAFRATAVLLCGLLATPLIGPADTAHAAGRFTCSSAGTPVTDLADVSISPDTVRPSARTLTVGAQLAPAATDVSFALQDAGGELVQAPAIATVGDRWSTALEVPEGTARSVLGLTVRWKDDTGTERVAPPCDLQAAGQPYQVFVDPVPPSAPVAVRGTGLDRAALVSWTPGEDGFSPITAWTVTVEPGGAEHKVEGSARSLTVPGLTNGVSHRFTVQATNRQGTGPALASAPVVPRRPAVVRSLRPVGRTVVHGTRTTVAAELLDRSGAPIADRPLQVHALLAGSRTWTVLAHGRSNSSGRATLSGVLRRGATLRLVHTADDVAATQVSLGAVVVRNRVGAVASRTRLGVGDAMAVRGSVSPARGGAVAQLQAFNGRRWVAVRSTRTTADGRYALPYRASTARTTKLRVLIPTGSGLAAAGSRTLHVTSYDTVRSLAKAILADRRVTLAKVHLSGGSDGADAYRTMQDLAAGRSARRSSYGGAPGGRTSVDIRLLRAIRLLSRSTTLTVSEIAGGSHARRSAHYRGLALDITWVGGKHVGSGAPHHLAVRACRATGATAVYSPSSDPYGGHSRHVHCDWSRR